MVRGAEFPGRITPERQAMIFKLKRFEHLERCGLIWLFGGIKKESEVQEHGARGKGYASQRFDSIS